MSVTETDLTYLARCVELAREALDAGDEPFGSVLVDSDGAIAFEGRNRTKDGDATQHPELEAARWAAHRIRADERAGADVYTSGEHCPMCSAAHAWMGLGRIVYAVSSAQLTQWRQEWGAAPGPVLPLSVQQVAPDVRVDGPVEQFAEEMKALHRAHFERQVRETR